MNEKIIYLIVSIIGIIIGILFAIKDTEIEKLIKENKELNQELIEYKWQIEQVPYVIESWCNGG